MLDKFFVTSYALSLASDRFVTDERPVMAFMCSLLAAAWAGLVALPVSIIVLVLVIPASILVSFSSGFSRFKEDLQLLGDSFASASKMLKPKKK